MKKETQKNLPYTIVGYGSLPNGLSITLTSEGIQELAKRMNKDDRVRIEEWSDITDKGNHQIHYSEISIFRKNITKI